MAECYTYPAVQGSSPKFQVKRTKKQSKPIVTSTIFLRNYIFVVSSCSCRVHSSEVLENHHFLKFLVQNISIIFWHFLNCEHVVLFTTSIFTYGYTGWPLKFAIRFNTIVTFVCVYVYIKYVMHTYIYDM